MSTQQINLFQSALVQPKEFLTIQQMGAFVGVGILGLLLVNGMQWGFGFSNSKKLRDLQSIQQQEIQTLAVLKTEAAKRAETENSEKFARDLKEKEIELQSKQQVIDLLSGKKFGNIEGFVPQFTGLAKQHVDGLWLTALHLQQGGEKLSLRGSTNSPELLPKYLQRLSNEPSLSGIEFKTFVMQRNKEKTQIDFDLRSVTDAKVK